MPQVAKLQSHSPGPRVIISMACFRSSISKSSTFAARQITAKRLSVAPTYSAASASHVRTVAVVTPKVCFTYNTFSQWTLTRALGQCGYRDEHCKQSCVANCDAKAPCGVSSKDGAQTCPLNLCCSHFGFCGVSNVFCRDETASGQSTPCQKGFGKCNTVSTRATPSCGKGSSTASRRIAYYEGW